MQLKAVASAAYNYLWSTGDTNASITITEPGTYSVEIKNFLCESRDSVTIDYEDCNPRMIMPNVFTPNGDALNEIFIPKESNYIDSGIIVIYNRWEEEIYRGDIFRGWDGGRAPAGTYFYLVNYVSRNAEPYEKRGTVTLMR